jgi:hypothetical protein
VLRFSLYKCKSVSEEIPPLLGEELNTAEEKDKEKKEEENRCFFLDICKLIYHSTLHCTLEETSI